MKYILILILSYSFLMSNDINSTLNLKNKSIEINYDKKENDINLIKKEFLKLLLDIKDNKVIPIKSNKKELNSLHLRILTNKKLSNTLAVKRDQIKIAIINNKMVFDTTINKLIKDRKNMESELIIKSHFNSNKKKLTKILFKKIKNPKGPVAIAFNKNLKIFNSQLLDITYKFQYLEDNLEDLIPKNFILDINIEQIISYINSFEITETINIYLKHFFKIDLGKIFISIFFIITIMLLKFIILPLIIKLTNPFIKNNTSHRIKELKELLHKTLNLPITILVFLTSLQFTWTILRPDLTAGNFNTIVSILYWASALWILNRLLSNIIEAHSSEMLKKYPEIRKEVVLFIKRVFSVISVLILISISLTLLGVELSTVMGGVGFIGLGASLAFKDTFSNFLGSINLIFDKTFSVGDWISIDNKEGTVIEVGMRKTRLRGFANNEYNIPNSILANSIVENWDKRKVGRRIKMKIGLTYDSSPSQLKKAKMDILNMLENHKDIANRNTDFFIDMKRSSLLREEDDHGIKNNILVYIDSLNKYSIDILVYAFSKSVSWEDWLETQEDVILQIMKIISDNKLEFAFPTQTIELEKN